MEWILRAYILSLLFVPLSACKALDFLLGAEPETITQQIDADGDGKLSKEEIQASKYDKDKDGELSIEEMQAAMAPHQSTDILLTILSMFNVPFAGALHMALKAARENKSHLKSVVGGIEDLRALGKDGYSMSDLTTALKISKTKRTNAVKLTKVVDGLITEVKNDKCHADNVSLLREALSVAKKTVS